MDERTTVVDAAAFGELAAGYAIESERPGLTRIAPGALLEECVRFCDNLFMARRMGSFSYFGQGCWIGNTDSIGRYCSIGQGVTIGAGPHPSDWLSSSTFFYRRAMWESHPLVREFYDDHPVAFEFDSPPCAIGNDVWIGNETVIVRGVTVGDGAIIGANSTVTKDVPPYAIVAGSPARVIRFRFPPATIDALLAARWWNLNPLKLKGFNYADIDRCLADLEALGDAPDNAYHPRSLQTADWVHI